MEVPKLKEVCDLIRKRTKYTSYTAIAKQLGIAESTLRGYWERYGGRVPDRHGDRFAAFIQEVVPTPLTLEAALDLLMGSELVFHSMLLPIGGLSWRKLLDEQVTLGIRTFPHGIARFGEVEGDDVPVADETVTIGGRFRLHGTMPWAGEGFLAAEHRGEWHFISLGGDLRTFEFEEGAFNLPASRRGRARYLVENDKPGLYHYIVIAQKDRLSASVRHHVHRTNPVPPIRIGPAGFAGLADGVRRTCRAGGGPTGVAKDLQEGLRCIATIAHARILRFKMGPAAGVSPGDRTAVTLDPRTGSVTGASLSAPAPDASWCP